MKIIYKPLFEQTLSKLSHDNIKLARETRDLFLEDQYHPSLRNHPLDPPLERYRTISVDADLRILFRMVDPSTALFLKIGTHDELYGKGNQ